MRCALATMTLLLVVTGCEFPGRPSRAREPVLPDKVLDFATLFSTHCAGCHGKEGNLGPAPPLDDPLFLCIASKDDLLHTLRNGRSGHMMPAFLEANGGKLTEEQLQAIVDGIWTTWRPSEPPYPSDAPPPALSSAKGTSEAPRGKIVFDRACAGCHGEEGQGGKLAGAIREPALLSLISDAALRRVVITGRHDLGMPDYAGHQGRARDFEPLTSQEIDDLVAFLGTWRSGSP